MKKYIGIGGSLHDFSTFILNEEGLAIGIEDERISQVRYALGAENPCEDSFHYCLHHLNIPKRNINRVYANDMLDGIIEPKNFPPIQYLNHHLTHAYSTYFTSPFEEAAILIADGCGSPIDALKDKTIRETISYYHGVKNRTELLQKVAGEPVNRNREFSNRNHSLGSFHDLITELAGFGFLRNGKTMGLAPYGFTGDSQLIAAKLHAQVTTIVKPPANGKLNINLKDEKALKSFIGFTENLKQKVNNNFVFSAGMALMGQKVFEENLFYCLNHLHKLTGSNNLCLAGGVMLNSMANGKIKEHTKFKNIHVTFSPGDSGTAIGAALSYIADKVKADDKSIHRVMLQPYLGVEYDTSAIEKTIRASGLPYIKSEDIHSDTAALLHQERIIAWFQGRSEYGPRALGNRSILATPTSSKIRDKINKIIKQREMFRPFAPVITEEAAPRYFTATGGSDWMQFVYQVKPSYHDTLQGITHVNGSARVQILKRRNNASFHQLVESFESLSNVPVLLNTSFNIQGKPMVETPEQAIEVFKTVPLDYLVIGDFIIRKTKRDIA